MFLNLSAVILLTVENLRIDKLALRRIAFAILLVMAVVPTTFEVVRAVEGASSRVNQRQPFAAIPARTEWFSV
jgi:hypothetical protein